MDATPTRRTETPGDLGQRRPEESLLEAAHAFIGVPEQFADPTEALGRLAGLLGFEWAQLATSADGAAGQERYAGSAAGVDDAPSGLGAHELPWSAERLSEGKSIQLLSLADLPPEATVDRAVYERLRVQSLSAVPIGVENRWGGVLWLVSRSHTVELPPAVVSQLRWIGEVLLSTVLRAQAVQRLARAETELQQHRREITHLSGVASLSLLPAAFAHELKQPLTAILSNAYAGMRFLRPDSIDRDELHEIFTDIVKDNERAVEVVRRLHALFQRGEPIRVLLDLNDVVRDIVALLRSELQSRSVTPLLELEARLPLISADPIQLQQVLLDLILNACKAMVDNRPDARRLTLRTGRGEPDTVRLSVIDNGAGIAPEDIERVFEPFFATRHGSTELGLAVSRRIIAAHGGRLWADSHTASGAMFSFILPAARRP